MDSVNSIVLSPRESGKFISDNSKNVKIRSDRIDQAAREIHLQMTKMSYSKKNWKLWPLHPKEMNSATIDWIFVVDCLNFSFWLPTDESQFEVEFNGNKYQDYEALCACVNRAIEEDYPITTPSWCQSLTLDQLQHIFRSCNKTTLPLLGQRLKNLQDAGHVITKLFQGSFSNVVASCKHSAQDMIRTVVTHFQSFQDQASYQGKTVCLYKRVQILIADIWSCFEGDGLGHFYDINKLTMFADYRVPQALLALGVMTYSNDLAAKISAGEELESKSEDEIEIRGCSIHAVELLKSELKNVDARSRTVNKNSDEEESCMEELYFREDAIEMNSVIIDFYLWDYATNHPAEMSKYPEHHTRSIYY